MNLQLQRQRLANKRELKRINKEFIEDFEDDIDDYVENDTVLKPREKAEKYILLASPFIIGGLFAYSTNVASMSGIRTQQVINKNIQDTIIEYKDHVTSCLEGAKDTLENLDIDKAKYVELREAEASVTEALQVSTPYVSEPVAPASPYLFKGSIENKMFQMESTDSYYGHTSLTDDGGNPLVYYKVWEWSELENTRHSEMDEKYVLVDETFTVINEVSGEEDEGLYPRDPSMSAGNIINCQCGLGYYTEDWDKVTL